MAKNSFQTLQPAIFRVLKNKLPLYVLKQFSHILTKRLLIYYVNVTGKFSQTVFGDSFSKSLIDLFTTSGFLSLRQKHRKIVSGHPSCVAKNQKLIGLIQEHNRNQRLCHKERGSFKGFDC